RDCDEAALSHGSQPADYARGIVSVCQTYTESPLPCAPGISGADLKKRIRDIMAWRGSLPITKTGKAVLIAAAISAISLPFAIGILRAQSLPPAPRYGYAAVSIHKSDPNERNIRFSDGPQGGIRTTNTTPAKMIAFAYHVEDYQIAGAPSWASSESFDVLFTPDVTEKTPDSQAGPQVWEGFWNRNRERMQEVLRDRFGLVLRVEMRELPIYRLLEANGGNKLVRHTDETKRLDITTNNNRQIRATDVTLDLLAAQLSMQFNRPVRNETHIDGEYDFTIDWVPDPELPEGPVIEALNKTLGLRVESAKGPVPVYVIEKLNHPTEN
ncbi:MAG TPA: TIGR03435 family protein, partial [Bryobacteraceae bacterium]|nr:TIGR03435 family protein [Bryobacteraceae bacterium]